MGVEMREYCRPQQVIVSGHCCVGIQQWGTTQDTKGVQPDLTTCALRKRTLQWAWEFFKKCSSTHLTYSGLAQAATLLSILHLV